MSKKLLALAASALFAFSTQANAQAVVPISGLPSASTPLSGAELVPCVQGGVTKSCHSGNLGAFLGTTPLGTSGATIPLLNGVNTWSGSQNFSAGFTLGSQMQFNFAAQSYSLFGQGAATSVSFYNNPTTVVGRDYALASIITDTASGTAGDKVGVYCAAQSAAAGSDIWGCNSLVQWNSGNPDINMQSIEVDANNLNSNTFSKLKVGLSINSGGTFHMGTGLLIGATSPGANEFNQGIFLNQSVTNGGDGILFQRVTDTSPSGNALRVVNAANSANLAIIGVNGSALFQSLTVVGPTTTTLLQGANSVSSVNLFSATTTGTGSGAACQTSHHCDSLGGEISLTTGTGALVAGEIVIVNFADTRTNIPSCVVSLSSGLGSDTAFHAPYWQVSTTSLTIFSGVALANSKGGSSAYVIDYVCNGN